MGIARRCSTTKAVRSCCRVVNPTSREGVLSHETGPTGLCALRLRPAAHLGGDRRAAHRATGLPGPAWVLRKGELPMRQTHHETHVTKNELYHPSTGQEASTTSLPREIIPTALVGPAQQGREPYPIILPHITIGVSVAPNVPALPAVLAVATPPRALDHQPTLVLTPITNHEKGEEIGTHEQHPAQEGGVKEPIAPPPRAAPARQSGYPEITTPIATPGDVRHTTRFPFASVGDQTQWSPRHDR